MSEVGNARPAARDFAGYGSTLLRRRGRTAPPRGEFRHQLRRGRRGTHSTGSMSENRWPNTAMRCVSANANRSKSRPTSSVAGWGSGGHCTPLARPESCRRSSDAVLLSSVTLPWRMHFKPGVATWLVTATAGSRTWGASPSRRNGPHQIGERVLRRPRVLRCSRVVHPPASDRRTREALAREGFLFDSGSVTDDVPYFDTVDGRPFLVVPYSLDINDVRFWKNQFFTADDFASYAIDAFDVLHAEARLRSVAHDVDRLAPPDHRTPGASRRSSEARRPHRRGQRRLARVSQRHRPSLGGELRRCRPMELASGRLTFLVLGRSRLGANVCTCVRRYPPILATASW